MKIIRCDNLNRETVPDHLVADNIQSEREAKVMIEALQVTCYSGGSDWYRIEKDEYRLSQGMADIVGDDEEDPGGSMFLEREGDVIKLCFRRDTALKAQNLFDKLLERLRSGEVFRLSLQAGKRVR